jgi:uncharacterized membrane protein YphA (DoxX/SURF4 family)
MKLRDRKNAAHQFADMGFSPGTLWVTIVALLEFIGGLACIIGLFTQIAAGLLAMQFLTIVVWKAKRGQPLIGGTELELALFCILLILFAMGGGVFAADSLMGIGF